MADRSSNRIAQICATLLGLLYIGIGIVVMNDPTRFARNSVQFWAIFSEDPSMRVLSSSLFAIGGLLGLAVVPAVSNIVRTSHEALVDWVSRLAFLGFAVTSVNFFRIASTGQRVAQTYREADEIGRAALNVLPPTELDPWGIMRYGTVGAWILVVNVLALRTGAWPRPLAMLGILGGALYWFIPFSNIAQIPAISAVMEPIVAILGGVVIAPIWYIWMGRVLGQSTPATQPARGSADGAAGARITGEV